LRAALSGDPRFDVVGEAGDGERTVEMAVAERPDIVLMDAEVPQLDGVIATLRIRRSAPGVKVVLLSTHEDEELGILALRAGAVGFLVKDVGMDALRRALLGVMYGEAAVSRRLAQAVIGRLRQLPPTVGGMRPVQSNLTSREWHVLDLMCAGRTTEEMAEELVLSIETIRSHVKHILAKLGARSRAEAVEMAEAQRTGGGLAAGPREDEEELDEATFREALERLRREREDV
jgi:DNA-binding NarL/FixJ family response regulator